MTLHKLILKSNISNQIAEHIESMILSQELKVGDKLPGEIALAEQYGASRNMLREAMTTLKERGLVEIKNGSGAYISQPNSDSLSNAVNRLVTFGDATAYEVYEVRMALEVRACGLAAKFASKEDLQVLHTLIANMELNYEDRKLWTQYDGEFHEALAQMTKISLFPAFLHPLISIVQSIAEEQPLPASARKKGLAAHKKIVDAIESRDRDAAENAMTSHLNGFLTDLVEIIEK